MLLNYLHYKYTKGVYLRQIWHERWQQDVTYDSRLVMLKDVEQSAVYVTQPANMLSD